MAIYLLIAALMLFPVSVMAGKTPVAAGSVPTFGDLPLFFEAFDGDPQGAYLARGPGYGLLLTPDGCAILGKGSLDPVILIRCTGGKRSDLEGVNPLPGRVNYLLGNDPKSWRNEVMGIAVDAARNIYMTGYTCSDDFPIKSAVQATIGKMCDAFVSKIADVSPNSLTLPEGAQPFIYDGPPLPLRDSAPHLANPIGVGSVANGGDMLSLSVNVGQFQAPVDLYLGFAYLGLIQLPGMIYPEIMLVKSDNQLQPLSQGIVPWKTQVTEVNENLYGDMPTELLPKGLYDLYLFVTPAGQLGGDFYLWKTSFYLAIPAFLL